MPLKLNHHPLPQARQEQLNAFLIGDTCRCLSEVVESLCQQQLVDAVNTTYDAKDQQPQINVASAAIEDARKYRSFLEVLDEVKSKDQHTTATLNPSTK